MLELGWVTRGNGGEEAAKSVEGFAAAAVVVRGLVCVGAPVDLAEPASLTYLPTP